MTSDKPLIPLPERYSVPEHGLTRARSIRGIVHYMRLLRGRPVVQGLLDELKLDLRHFAVPETYVSPLIGQDLLDLASRNGFTDFQMRQMGTMTLVTNYATSINKVFSVMESPRQLYEKLHTEHIGRFDQLWTYKMTRLTATSCTVEVHPREQIQELFRTKRYGSRRMCLFLQGVYMSLLGNIEPRLARLRESQCFFEGCSHCVFHLHWD